MYIIMYKYSTFNRNRKYFLSFQYVKELPAVIPGLTGDLAARGAEDNITKRCPIRSGMRLPVKPAMT